jgi:predicted ATPase
MARQKRQASKKIRREFAESIPKADREPTESRQKLHSIMSRICWLGSTAAEIARGSVSRAIRNVFVYGLALLANDVAPALPGC